MFAYLMQRMIALIIIVKGWDLSEGHGWRWAAGLIMFIAGVYAFESVIRKRQSLQLMPHQWNCPIHGCHTRIQSSDEDVFYEMRRDHNRTIHLQEP